MGSLFEHSIIEPTVPYNEKVEEIRAIASRVSEESRILQVRFSGYKAYRDYASSEMEAVRNVIHAAQMVSGYSSELRQTLFDITEHMRMIQSAFSNLNQAVIAASEFAKAIQPYISKLAATRGSTEPTDNDTPIGLVDSIYESLDDLSVIAESHDSSEEEIELADGVANQATPLLDAAMSVAGSNVGQESSTQAGRRIITSTTLWMVIQFVLMVLAIVVPVYLSDQQSKQIENQIVVDKCILEQISETNRTVEKQTLLLQSIDDSLKALVESAQITEQNVDSLVHPEVQQCETNNADKHGN